MLKITTPLFHLLLAFLYLSAKECSNWLKLLAFNKEEGSEVLKGFCIL
jgi:hypothetical protein